MNNNRSSWINSAISAFFLRTTSFFSVIVFVFSLIGVLFENTEMLVAALPCSMIMWTALFAVLMAIVGFICDILIRFKVNTVLLYTVHFLLSYAAFLASYVFGNGAAAYLSESAVTNLAFKIIVMTLIFIGLYVVASAVRLVFSLLINKYKNKNKAYENIYTDSEQAK